jgi:DNA (cytosine-5)-methyltransferase 1
MAPTVISLFAGRGGSSLGYSMAGYRELLAADFNPHACATLRENFPASHVHEGDVNDLSVNAALDSAGLAPGELDVLDGSPPCRGFSTAGKRSTTDNRSRLFEQYVRLLTGLRPRALVVENVSGLVKGKMKAVFVEIFSALEDAGYKVTARVLNAMYYGVPQSRQRVIFIGLRKDVAGTPSHPAPATARVIPLRDAIDLSLDPPDLADCPTLKGKYGNVWKWVPLGGSAEDVIGQGYTSCQKPHPGKPCNTIISSGIKGGVVGTGFAGLVHPLRPRPIAPSELKAIASFPEGYAIRGTYEDIYHGIANSVPPLFMKAIAAHVHGLLREAAT